jgi:hypothetical protein
MNAEKAARELKVIRQLMERPVRYSTMSGLSGILAGLAALGGLAADWAISNAWQGQHRAVAMKLNVLVWAGVLVVAFAGAVICTRLRELRQGMPFWSAIKKKILLTILPPFVAGVGLTLVIVYRTRFDIGPNEWGLIPPIWMLFYGLALWQVGLLSPVEVRLMGVAFLAAGLATALWLQPHPYWSLGVSFGGFHIVYGLAVWVRHGG